MNNIYGTILVYFAGALAVTLPGIGSAKALGRLGKIAAGIIAEDPTLFGKLLILQALPGTQGIYGLLGWFMIMSQSGVLSGNTNITLQQGLMLVMAAIPLAAVGLLSAAHQGWAPREVCAHYEAPGSQRKCDRFCRYGRNVRHPCAACDDSRRAEHQSIMQLHRRSLDEWCIAKETER